ncbi:MAG: NfeD family protein [Bacillota bacterium]
MPVLWTSRRGGAIISGISAVLLFFGIFMAGSFFSTSEAAETVSVHEVTLSGTVDAGQASLLRRAISSAEEDGSDVLFVRITTFGGAVNAAVDMKDMLLDSSLTTVAFVSGRSWSAGVLLTVACDHIFMAPGSSLGAAQPIPADEKTISAVKAEMETTAKARGRDPEIVAAMVDERLEIEDVIASGELLTLTAQRAEELGFIDGMASDVDEALEKLDFAPGSVTATEPTTTDLFAQYVTDPYIAPLILAVGFVGVLVEMFVPGFGFPGGLGLLAFATYFVGHIAAGYAGMSIALLFVAGIGLLVAEVFVPGFGVVGIGGILAMLASIYLASPTPAAATWSILAAILAVIITAVVLVKMGTRLTLWRRLLLDMEETQDRGYVAQSDLRALEGREGVAVTSLRPAGTIEVDGERIDVVTFGEYIPKDTAVEVVRVEGRRVIVRAASAREESSGGSEGE